MNAREPPLRFRRRAQLLPSVSVPHSTQLTQLTHLTLGFGCASSFPSVFIRVHPWFQLFGDALTAPVEIPPSTNNVWPVTYALASDAKKTTAPSRSCGCPGRFSGIRSLKYSTHSRSSYITA